ncbi:MAG: glycogen synthase GlgA [Pseudomonadota bacterium]
MRPALSVVSECVPLIKTGGLADVAGALPGAMAGEGWALRTLIPFYPALEDKAPRGDTVWRADDLFGGPAEVFESQVGALDLLCLDAPHLYTRAGNIYLAPDGRDWPDYAERFAALAWVGAEIALGAVPKWRPDLVHMHDWQAALLPAYLAQAGIEVPTLLTIHNIAFQGLAGPEKLGALRLAPEGFNPDGFEFYGRINMLKAGIVNASAISTVSPTYAEELLSPAYGMGLEGILQARSGDLHGILNGIDTDVWTPDADPDVATFKTPAERGPNRAALIKAFELDPEAKGPIAVVVSRLTEQKGLDLLLGALPVLLERGGQLALLGSGAAALEDGFRRIASHPRVGVRIGYDEALSHLMFAGGDAVLVPSRFEPCGLTQLYGLRYGAVPVVARTGGLADTVIHANALALRAGVATGLHVAPVTTEALARALSRLCDLYADRATWRQLQTNAMAQPVGWDASAAQYARLYTDLAG